ncbi:MAG: response regulator [Acidobacteriaceae bacterium]|nr:response regulator [Acidobacteriaceae bacterium]
MPEEPVNGAGEFIPLSKALIQANDSGGFHASSSAIIERYRQILHGAVETAVITMDLDGLVTGWSDGAKQILGWAEEEMLGHSLAQIFPVESGGEKSLQMELADALHKGTGGSEGWRSRKDGSRLWAIGETKPLYDGLPTPIGFVKILRDRTKERDVETALREQTRTLEILHRAGMTLARENDISVLVQAVTDARVELSGAEFGAFFHNVIDATGESYMLYTLSGAPREAFSQFPMPRNTEVFAPTFTGEAIVRSDDITKDPRYGKNAPREGMPEGHLPVRSYLAVPVVSRSGEVLGGLFFGHSTPGVFKQQSELRLGALAAEAAIAIDNARLFEAAQREVDERRRAEEALRALNANLENEVRDRTAALRQAQKMEAVGQLTGGIAHDFNNLLQVIVGNLETVSRNLPEEMARLRRAAAQAMNGAQRAAALTQRLLAFARRQPLDPKPLDVNVLVRGMSELLRRSLGETVEVEIVLGGGLWRTEADPNELESALLNLAVNARDAMPSGGKLTIETSNGYLDEAYAARHAEVTSGQYVLVSMSDTGTGMDQETLSRVFEPFFTTKSEGKGTGLGLSQVYGFVKQSHGHVKLYSELGEGTTVKIYLPRLVGDLAEHDLGNGAFAPEAAVGEVILVVEDDEDVRAYSVAALRELGYIVLEAADGSSALAILESRTVDLIFTDVVLPGGISGAEVVARGRTIRPRLKALFTSGYSRNAIVHHGRLDRGVSLIPKPFTYEELAGRVRDILDGRQ